MHETLKRSIGRKFHNIYIFFVAKKAVISKDIKAERKSNPFKKAQIGKEEFRMFSSIPKNTKNLKDKNTKYQ